MVTNAWGVVIRADFPALAAANVIPAGTPVLVYEKVSWWRSWFAKPRETVWPPEPINLVASIRLPANSGLTGAIAVWYNTRFR